MAGKPSRTAILHLARSIPLRLDDLCINTLVLETASVNSSRSGRIFHSQPQSSWDGTQPALSKPSFYISYRPNQLKKIFLPRYRLWNFCPLHKSIGLAKAFLFHLSLLHSSVLIVIQIGPASLWRVALQLDTASFLALVKFLGKVRKNLLSLAWLYR